MRKNVSLTLVVAGLLSSSMVTFPALAEEAKQPKLVLQITVDGLRGDLLERYKHNFGEGGFRYLMDEGTYYTNANYEHGNTETIVGHVSLATGAPPACTEWLVTFGMTEALSAWCITWKTATTVCLLAVLALTNPLR